MMSEQVKTLEEQLCEEDWALIIGKDGSLKGLFIPESSDSKTVPHSIVYITKKYFGVDISEELSEDFEKVDVDDKPSLLH